MSYCLTVISDPHGCYNTLLKLLEKIPSENNRIVIIGDITDRGPKCYEMFQYVKEHEIEMVLGNHEYMLMHSDDDKKSMDNWMQSGGKHTMASLKKNLVDDDKIAKGLKEMKDYFSKLPLFIKAQRYDERDLLISHAGVGQLLYSMLNENLDRCLKLSLDESESCIWNREPLAILPGYIQIVGHTPVRKGPRKKGRNFYLDTGCVYKRFLMGYMSALKFDLNSGDKPVVYKQKNID